ncbi:MAG: hypothetical protein KJ941_08340 [Bacteroidetes bacterium]|nr:hypothetical protein [Bacteroidota bacterium]
MNRPLIHVFRFIAFVLIQVFVLNQIELGWGILPMICPLVIFLLPVELETSMLMLIAFVMGVCVDSLSNTFGLHTSSLVLFAYLRPWVFKRFAPREDYELNKETNLFTMGTNWFVTTFGTLILIHHLWFFLFELADLSEIGFLIQKVLLSVIVSFLLCVGLQIIFVKKPKER